jgi:thymidylate kinase
MFTVALIGADGAGKTTIARRLERARDLRIKYIYMGINREAATHALPTTRLFTALRRRLGRSPSQGGPPDPGRRPAPRRGLRGLAGSLKSNLRMANQLAEEWYQQAVAWWYRRRGFIVLCDRHFYFDFRAHDVAHSREDRATREGPEARGVPLLRRLHGYMLDRVYPRPDLTIVLDAPAEVLFARKPEGTPDLLERRRREYLDLAGGINHAVIDASQPQDRVESAVIELIRDFRNRGSGRRGVRRGGGAP